jgi:hypothetical protein
MGQAAVADSLPPIGSTFDGIPVAQQYDQFYGFSTDLMTQLQTAGYMDTHYGNYNFATGTGGLDVLLYTGSKGQDNLGVGPGGAYNFEDPVLNSGGSTTEFEGWWGQNDPTNSGTHAGHNGPVTVGQVRDYLHAFDPLNDIPIFYADVNQTGKDPTLYVSIDAYLADPTTFAPIPGASWALDAVANSSYDETSPAMVGNFSVTGTSGNTYNVDIAKGSGKPDFIFYSPGMDLSGYSSDLLFVMNGHIGNLSDGFEEFFLTGGLSTHLVPAPAGYLLLSGGLLVLLGMRRRSAGSSTRRRG